MSSLILIVYYVGVHSAQERGGILGCTRSSYNYIYGVAINQHLLNDSFEWEHEPIDITSIPDDTPMEYLLGVDLEYPKELHETYKDVLSVTQLHAFLYRHTLRFYVEFSVV